MGTKFWSAALVAPPVLVVALVYGRNLNMCCHPTESASVTADDSDRSECSPSDRSPFCPQENRAEAPRQSLVQGGDPDKQIVFKLDGLGCPAVKGIGCGHMLRFVLASLDKIDGVEASSTNYTGTMIRVSVTKADDRSMVAEEARKVLAENKPVALAGDEFKLALEREQWRQTSRVGELSAIEFHTLIRHRMKTFVKAEKLDQQSTDKLATIVEEEWQRVAEEANKDGATQPEDWQKRCKASLPVFLERVKEVLTAEQVGRLKESLTCPSRGDDRPDAPPALEKKENDR